MITELTDMRLPAAFCAPAKPLRSNRMRRKLASLRGIAFSKSRSTGCITRKPRMRCRSGRVCCNLRDGGVVSTALSCPRFSGRQL